MNPASLSAASELLQHYSRDSTLRWTQESRDALQAFVSERIAGRNWLDWSNESAALQIMQAFITSTDTGFTGNRDAILIAGPIAEIVEPTFLFQHALRYLKPKGCVVGVIPCLRDNSPESSLFCEFANKVLWPYCTAEELLELLIDAGLTTNTDASNFLTVPEFNQAVLKDQLAFKGYRKIFDQIQEQGYDAMEIGWGELRFEAWADE